MTTAALAASRAALPDSVVEVRRFRPSLVIDAETAIESAIEPGRLAVGDAVTFR